ncbi:cyclopropane-fatty-acyl-phospholipid synthase family protein [Mesorhizobium sp. CN2-181]|uniref:SAM-dependent methyltransferase n=1 Tax=Mesorhizobium yinganensis TaxID=3157707 RepID=UPI0032B78305
MSLMSYAIRAFERIPLPDLATQYGIDYLVDRTRRRLANAPSAEEAHFASSMTSHAIAYHADAANKQHYELPPEFFALTLGPRRKYSSCYYETGNETLAEAENLALALTIEHAALADGQTILELGCGWGSLTLFMAERYPSARIVAVSNSAPQRLHIQAEAAARGLRNVEILTADMNAFEPKEKFDRVISVEMFEHMSNWAELLSRIRIWLVPNGKLFVHVFSHRHRPYRFDHRDDADWIAQHFFTGGVMPSHGLMGHFPNSFSIERDWRWSGLHYQKTALDWLARFDTNHKRIDQILSAVYGDDASLWRRRWRIFYLATAGLFGNASGTEWGVSHYLLRPAQ